MADQPATDKPTQAEVEQHPDALTGRALLEEQLKRFSPDEVAAFREAVRRCFASAVDITESTTWYLMKEADGHPAIESSSITRRDR